MPNEFRAFPRYRIAMIVAAAAVATTALGAPKGEIEVLGLQYGTTGPIKAGQTLQIGCAWMAEKATLPTDSVQIQISVDGKPIPTKPKGLTAPTGTFVATASWKPEAGSHLVACVGDPYGSVDELNEKNNKVSETLEVQKALHARSAEGNMAGSGARALFPNPKTKACKAMIYADLAIDPTQFSPAEDKPKFPGTKTKVTLDLVKSYAVADYVHCEYISIGKDAMVAYTYDCPGASPTGKPHIFACQ